MTPGYFQRKQTEDSQKNFLAVQFPPNNCIHLTTGNLTDNPALQSSEISLPSLHYFAPAQKVIHGVALRCANKMQKRYLSNPVSQSKASIVRKNIIILGLYILETCSKKYLQNGVSQIFYKFFSTCNLWQNQRQEIKKNLLGYPKRIISDCLLWPSPPSTTSRLACTTGRKFSCCLFLKNKTLSILDKPIDYLRFWHSVWAVWQSDIAGICLRGAVGGGGHIVSPPGHLHCTKLLCQHTCWFGDKPAKWLYRWVPRGKF